MPIHDYLNTYQPTYTPNADVPMLYLPEHRNQPAKTKLHRYVNYIADSQGCGFWRMLWPEMVINMSGKGLSFSQNAMVPLAEFYDGITAVKVQRQMTSPQKIFMRHLKEIQKKHHFKIIYEVDDLVFGEYIPEYNFAKAALSLPEQAQNSIDIINMTDEMTVSCEYLKKIYQEKTGKKEITVVPNFLPKFWMGNFYNPSEIIAQYDKNIQKPRILYTGSVAHFDLHNKNKGLDDFSEILPFVIETRQQYRWILIGAYPPALKPYVEDGSIEFHKWQSLLEYPELIRSLNVQLMIAPLLDNDFNKCKSDIKYIEACALGLPCLAQRLEPYKDLPEHLLFHGRAEFIEKLRRILEDKKTYLENIPVYRAVAEARFLEREENIGCHLEIMNTPYGSPMRKFLRRFN